MTPITSPVYCADTASRMRVSGRISLHERKHMDSGPSMIVLGAVVLGAVVLGPLLAFGLDG
ncbi:hypothetical protein [Cupriavidus basilensis]|uniref:Uncharacterized protein n=1 Tax=Cupriavidus basilensis TaxID=68895 RepID=A0A0C4YCI1_9BURK|nr:hypothetical protein [Cupriavidus basilensis]AJG23307.1 hypothetical protein RR42_s1719 [Cupriavidus basilensis]